MSPLDRFDDPRPPPSELSAEAVAETLRPRVADRESGGSLRLILGGAAALGLVAFLWLGSTRTRRGAELQNGITPSGPSSAEIVASPPPPELGVMEAAGRGGSFIPPPPPVIVTSVPTASAPPPVVVQSAPANAPAAAPGAKDAQAVQRRKAPVLVVDLGGGAAAAEAATSAAGAPAGAAGALVNGRPVLGAQAAGPQLNPDEQFAARVEAVEPERVRATMLRNQPYTVPQGAMIPGVLETALNSDLPGYARAVVSRDVRSFDGANVLIPRGSRVIGQYRSAVALGQSRAFVIWTRVIRPDGGSIQIGSSGADQLGRAGMEGKVDRHFFQRFGGALLLSVVNTGTAVLTARAAPSIGISSPTQATGLASTIGPTDIPPTIKVVQGTPIRIFVARDLDFSTVQNAQ